MKKFDFSAYKGSMQYFSLFDVLIKENTKNKEYYLIDHDIPPSSYRRCRISEQKTGVIIINKLAKLKKLTLTNDSEIDELEKFTEKVYYNITYKIYKTHEQDIEYLNKLIEKRSILFPVAKLLLLFLKSSVYKTASNVVEENIDEYRNVKKYKAFFVDDLQEIYELLTIFFEGNNRENIYLKNYNNSIAYTILSSQAYTKEDFVACLYFANKAKEISEKEGNIRRILYLNGNIMSSLLYVGNYEECYELAYRQLLILESLEIDGQEKKLAYKFLTVSAFGKKDFEKVIELLEGQDSLDLTRLTCLLVSYYFTNKKVYDELYKNGLNYDNMNSDKIKYLKSLNAFLKNPDRKHWLSLVNPLVMKALPKILKKMQK